MSRMLRNTIWLILFLCSLATSAQEETEYTMEIGGGAGLDFCMNDTHGGVFAQPRAALNGVLRFVLNQRNAVKIALDYGMLSGNTTKQTDFQPSTSGTATTTPLQYEFSGSLIGLTALYELHFLPYGFTSGYQGLKRFVPYIQIGLGGVYGTRGKSFGLTVPVGFGIKYKLKERLNLGAEWRMHFTTTDKLDGLADPHGIKSFEFKNKDHYSMALFTITYSFAEKCKTCNKDDW